MKTNHKKPYLHYPKSLPVWAIVAILLVIPPVAWYYMWKHRNYHIWLSNSLFLYSISTLAVGLYLFFFQFAELRTVYKLLGIEDGLTIEQVLISIPILLSCMLLILALFLKDQIKKNGKLTTNQLSITLFIIVLYSIVIPMGYTLYNLESNEMVKYLMQEIKLRT